MEILSAGDSSARLADDRVWRTSESGQPNGRVVAILARARLRFPNTVSVLMDEDTLLAHRKLWVREPTPCRVESPEGLTVAELTVYEGLRANRWGEQVRLELERIAWPAALEAISKAIGTHL